MHRRNLIITLLFMQMLVLLACNDVITDPQQQAHALLIWTGDPAADAGCGFFIRINQTEYKAENEHIIPKSLRLANPTTILVTFRNLADPLRYNCSRGADAVGEGIRLYSIQKKE